MMGPGFGDAIGEALVVFLVGAVALAFGLGAVFMWGLPKMWTLVKPWIHSLSG